MAEALTITITKGSVRRYELDWQSASDGSVTQALGILNGQIERVVFKPDSGGTQPSADYDIVIEDAEAVDVLAGKGANLANNVTTSVVPVVTDGNAGNMSPMAVAGPLTLKVTNAGDTKGGLVILYVR